LPWRECRADLAGQERFDLLGSPSYEGRWVKKVLKVPMNWRKELIRAHPVEQVIVSAVLFYLGRCGHAVSTDLLVDFLAVRSPANHGHNQVLGSHER
jgi:hypothetical protein